ncbi:MAG TPA: glycosyltransferase family 1 protein [Pyrinomonadaceae bacterium]|jgi:glycosyltransferase involved in cell wall biosynthesis|nr:glycosyltransferase family 1 protein [Pyrinomonadaceae bacterium]
MYIGLDGIPLNEPRTGVGHYTLELARALAVCSPSDEFEIASPLPFLPLMDQESEEHLPPNLSMVQVEVNALSKHWWTIGLPRYIKRKSFALFHGTNYDVPLWKRCPTVLTIHDLSLLLYPLTHEPGRVRRARRRLPLMASAATMIITPTMSVRGEVCAHLSISPEKVVPVPEAPRDNFRPINAAWSEMTRKRLGVEDEFVLFVGTIEPRKNLRILVQAFALVSRATGARTQLVIAGKKGWLTDDLFVELKASGVAERVLFTGYLPDEDLCALYSSCMAFVYPSLYEGFGLPPLEAMACGAPVIASRIPSLVEITGPVARLFAPDNPQELAQHIITLLADEGQRRHLSMLGRQRAAEFSWKQTALKTLEVYAEAKERG